MVRVRFNRLLVVAVTCLAYLARPTLSSVALELPIPPAKLDEITDLEDPCCIVIPSSRQPCGAEPTGRRTLFVTYIDSAGKSSGGWWNQRTEPVKTSLTVDCRVTARFSGVYGSRVQQRVLGDSGVDSL